MNQQRRPMLSLGSHRSRAALLVLLLVACGTQSDPLPAPSVSPNLAERQATAPSNAEPSDKTPQVVLSPPGRDPVRVKVEIAKTPADRQRGLMFREHMSDDAGMLFLFERPQQLAFWMHNTFIPLDMIFIRSDMTILGVVENAEPRTDDSRQVPGQSQYVLEVNAGFARKHGVGPGHLVKFEGIEGVSP